MAVEPPRQLHRRRGLDRPGPLVGAVTRLVELDLEQDCWNQRQARFSDEAAHAVANSFALRRLDSLFGGQVDEYHCSREEHPFTTIGLAAINAASSLRPALRASLRLSEAFETEVEKVEEAPSMTKEAAREQIQNLQDAITQTFGDAGKPASDILGALLASGGNDPVDILGVVLANGGNDPVISPRVETPPPSDPPDDLRHGYTTDFRFRARLGKDRRAASQ